jgi:hypothetical protein
MEQRAIVRLLVLKGLKAQEIEMELTSTYADSAFQIYAVKKSRTRVGQRRIELEDDPRSGRPANSDLIQVIAQLVREHPFLSCRILCRHLRVSKERCLRILHEKLALKMVHV